MNLSYTLLFLICCVFSLKANAQTVRKISGSVTDTTEVGIGEANVLLIAGKDTLKTTTDESGIYRFKTAAEKFSLQVSIVGYETRIMTYALGTDKDKHTRLSPVELKLAGRMLEEVVIKGKPNLVRFMQDTIEYNAAALQVMEGDNIADLLRQLPGVEIGDDYSVKTKGKNLTKLRVNGEDFFTSDVQDFIGKLPAGIVGKIQLIDDFGDEADFTGIKLGEPQKMLNIVTKPGMDKGTFGNASGSTGTNEMAGASANGNLWNKSKQSAANMNLGTFNNGAGSNNTLVFGINHRNKIGKNGSGGLTYNFTGNDNAFTRQQIAESASPEGAFINNSTSEGNNGRKNHNLGGNYTYRDKNIYLQSRFNGSYSDTENENSLLSNQYGLIRQDLKNISLNTSSSPQVNGSVMLSKKFNNQKNNLSVNLNFSLSERNGTQSIHTNTLYYDKATGALQKDSLLRRNLENSGDSKNLGLGFNYSLGLKKPKDSLARQSLNLSYSISMSASSTAVSTFVFDNYSNQISFIDSLSTDYRSAVLTQVAAANYNYSSRKMRYNFGINVRPNLMTNNDFRLQRKIVNNTVNYSPNVNIGRTLSQTKSISISYTGSNLNPSINQLQPIRNTVNLQNIVVGNPDLKPAFSHNLNGNFNYTHVKSAISVQLGLRATATHREIVEHVVLVPDTLNSLKQITRFENINGNYSFGGNYYINIPLFKNKYSINYSGSAGLSNRAVIFNNQKAFGQGLNFSQGLSSQIIIKKFSMNTRISYSVTNGSNADQGMIVVQSLTQGLGQFNAPAFFRRSAFSAELNSGLRLKNFQIQSGLSYNTSHNDGEGDQRFRDISTVNLNLSGSLTIKKSYQTRVGLSKQLNYGYTLANTNPLLLNATVSKSFFKNKQLSFNIDGNDLLGQGNNISRVVSGNTIIDQRNNQQTRVISLRLSYNLSKFGGKSFIVHPD